MKQKNLALWLKLIIIGMAVCGLGVYGYFLPVMGKSLSEAYPEFADRYIPATRLYFSFGKPPCR